MELVRSTRKKVEKLFQSPEGKLLSLLCQAGYKLVDPPLIKSLTLNQQIFIALSQNDYFSMMLAPYIDKSPSKEAVMDEEMRMRRLAKKFKNVDAANIDLFKWNGKDPLYE